MSIRPFTAAALTTAKSIKANANAVTVKTVKVYNNGTLSLAFAIPDVPPPTGNPIPALSASANPTQATGNGSTSKPINQNVTSNSVTVTPSNGTAPYRYSWTIGNSRISISAPSSASTYFSATLSNQELTADAVCAVTDANGQQATVTVPVDLSQQSDF